MLEVGPLDAFYGESQILHSTRLSVAAGRRVAVLGRNGAGKTTLLKSIMNAGPRTRGPVIWGGRDLGGLSAWRRARLGLALVPEDRRIFSHLTVKENIEMAAWGITADRPTVDVEEVLNRIPMLAPLADRLGGQLSGGQQQMAAVARGLAARPQLLMLDEPTEGLAPRIVEEMARELVDACEAHGTALLLSEQNLWFARRCTEAIYVIDTGQIMFHGNWAEFDADPEVAARYLAV